MHMRIAIKMMKPSVYLVAPIIRLAHPTFASSSFSSKKKYESGSKTKTKSSVLSAGVVVVVMCVGEVVVELGWRRTISSYLVPWQGKLLGHCWQCRRSYGLAAGWVWSAYVLAAG